MLKVYNNSENYAAQVCKLPEKVTVTGLDNLVAVTYHGNTCLISKDSDPNVIEEGFCIRVDKYPKPNIYKIKSKSFLLKESNWKDKQIIDIEEQT